MKMTNILRLICCIYLVSFAFCAVSANEKVEITTVETGETVAENENSDSDDTGASTSEQSSGTSGSPKKIPKDDGAGDQAVIIKSLDELKSLVQATKEPQYPLQFWLIAGGGLFVIILTFIVIYCVVCKRIKALREDFGNIDKKAQRQVIDATNKSINSLSEKLGDIQKNLPSSHQIITGIEAKLPKVKSDDSNARNEQEILATVRAIKESFNGELKRLREQENEVTRKAEELKSKITDAERMRAEAQAAKETFEADKNRAVESAKATLRSAMENHYAAEHVKEREDADQKQKEISKLQNELYAAKRENLEADKLGYERGIAMAQEKNEKIVRENAQLNAELAQIERETRSKLEEQFRGKTAQLEAELKVKGEAISQLTTQKAQSEQNVIALQHQMTDLQSKLSSEQKTLAEAEGRVQDAQKEVAAKAAMVSKLEGEKAELNASIEHSKETIEALTKENETKAVALDEAEKKMSTLQGFIYPAEYVNDQDFSELKEHLDGWLNEKIIGAELVKSALGLFAQKAVVNQETWQQALRNIAVGISRVMHESGHSPEENMAELVKWRNFLMKFSDENYDFSLEIPNIGSDFDSDKMSSSNKSIKKVRNVISWVVRHNQFGVMHNAEVE